ncbi:DegV family protein [Candidatus Desulforudis audaxviator]|uniref:DegV family protein n=1 Tax=Desulforudis audaxviator (strain MP104C) TaxID=477974 RepID=B1I3R1_DESAP|nr:DegV family protein [Candidatus Desulforudis audaxviator]ACA59618.1 degV family protein [Candidatus Desulforudis audaxviator MP104C]AZK59608.1 DegV family protein [Candidatus Desulforudis audaxviator]
MKSVHIVTDSTADIPAELAERHEITVVPLKVIFSDEEFYRDGIDLTPEQFFVRLAELPASTSQPSPAEFLDVYRPLAEQGRDIISVHISAALSGTVHSAQAARALLPDASVEVIDSKVTSIPLGMAVLAAARAAQAGLGRAEILELLNSILDSTGVYFMVDTLEYLQRGGRIGRAQGLLGTLLNIKPILMLKDGLVTPLDKVRGRAKGLERLAGVLEEAARQGPIKYGITHGNTPELFARLEEKLTTRVGFGPDLSCRVGGVIGAHVGPSVVGFSFHRDVGW